MEHVTFLKHFDLQLAIDVFSIVELRISRLSSCRGIERRYIRYTVYIYIYILFIYIIYGWQYTVYIYMIDIHRYTPKHITWLLKKMGHTPHKTAWRFLIQKKSLDCLARGEGSGVPRSAHKTCPTVGGETVKNFKGKCHHVWMVSEQLYIDAHFKSIY